MNKVIRIWLYNVGGVFTVTVDRQDGTSRTYTPKNRELCDRICDIAYALWMLGWVVTPFPFAHGYTVEAA